jgi:hypothetical protein
MTSKRESVIAAIAAKIAAAVPAASVKRHAPKPERIPTGGLVVIRDGDPGEPEVILSPLVYIYTHRIIVEIAAVEALPLTREQVCDQLTAAIGVAVAADRTLGGLCDWVEPEAATSADIEAQGTQAVRFAEFVIIAVYGTGNPLN